MTKLAFALGLINQLRREKTPPMARYCCLLSLAENPGRLMTAPEIFRRFGLPEAFAGTLDSAVRTGLVEEIPGAPAKLYRITPAGSEIVTSLLAATPEQLPPPKRKPKAGTASL